MRRPFRDRSAAGVHAASMPNMTPMVDIVMVILVFFMATAAVMGPEWLLKTALPTKTSGKAAPAEITPIRLSLVNGINGLVVSVTVGASGNEPRRELATTFKELDGILAALVRERGAANLAVSVEAADDILYESVVRAHEACQRAGISRVGVPGR